MRPGQRASSRDLRVLVSGIEDESLASCLGDADVAWERIAPDRLGEARAPDAAEHPPPLLVLLPDPGDLSSLRAARKALPDHPLVAVFLPDATPDASAVREAGCDDVVVLGGPAAPEGMREAIERAAERRGLLSRIERIEGRLEASEHRFHNTVQRVADGIMIVAEDGIVRFANRAAEEMFGREAGELRGEDFGLPVSAGETAEIDILAMSDDEEPGTAELRVTRTEWDDEPCLLVSVRDITGRLRAAERERQLVREQAARREAEAAAERNELLAEASRALYGSLETGTILDTLADLLPGRVGEACLVETTGTGADVPAHRSVGAPAEGPGAAVARSLRERGLGALPADAIDRVLTEGEVAWLEDPPLDGVRCALLLPLALDEEVVGVLAIMDLHGGAFDHGGRVLARELARRAGLALENARLFRLSRQASRAKSDFLNVMSHELRTPLSGITGYAGLLEEGIAGRMSEAQRRWIRGIERSSDQLLRVIDQILLYADSEEERAEVTVAETSLTELLEDVVSLARPMAERESLELRVDAPEGDVRLRMDAPKVRQILLHLLTNAVKFTREGCIELMVDPAPDRLVLRVTDSGIGIPADQQARVFEPFTQIEDSETRVVGGTGIGLNVARNLARMLGGTIDLRSAPAEGSTFTVSLPVVSAGEDGAG